MFFNEPFMSHPRDHIMANTWRLIFELPTSPSHVETSKIATDFSEVEQLLPEYRLIGFSLANYKQRRYD